MGRHKNIPHEQRGIERGEASNKKASAAVLERLGFGKQICQRCNAKSPADADKCRKCGYGDLRKKKHDYRAEYTSNNSGR